MNDHDSTIIDRPKRQLDEISVGELEALPRLPGFTFDRLVGSGGMGRVYRARDIALDRWVAVKLLRLDDPETVVRFAREARAQARIQHEHVCPVYEVGEADGRPYIVMAFVDGSTLLDVVEDLGLEGTVAVIADVADALHAAHRTGLIHRDIKPSNIMVEYLEDRGWHGWVLDFGIAQESAGEDLTVTGATLGTPAFMSPEQALGGRRGCDRRTDVYGLGATLYRALTGRPPYEGSNAVDVLVQVAGDEPPAPRSIRPSIPKDLETIILKCLEKDPGRRYETAAALADDLRRFLAGESIQARRADWTYRLAKIVKRNRLSAAVILASVMTIAVIGGLALNSVWKARREVVLAQGFSQEIKEMESTMQKAFMLPLHDIRPENKEIRARMEGIERKMNEEGSVARGPGHYALGCGYRVLGQFPEARRYLSLTWEDGFRNPDVASALGLTLGELYKLERIQALRLTNEAVRNHRLEQIEEEYRDPALRFLQQISDQDPARRAFANGLIAYYEERYDEGLKLARESLEYDPTLYRAYVLEADIDIALGTARFASGEVEEAGTFYADAGEALGRAVEIGRSDPAVHRSRCRLLTMMLESSIQRGTANEADFNVAADVCGDGVLINPDDVDALAAVSQLCWRWGTQLMKIGADPVPVLQDSIEMAAKAVSLAPSNTTALNDLGVAYSKLGLNDLKNGTDPTENLRAAIDAFDRATALESSGHQAFNNRGLARWRLGQWAMAAGDEPLPYLEQAAEDFRASLRIVEKDSIALVNLGAVLLTAGMYELPEGLDPSESINEAIAVFEQTLEINPRMAIALNSLGAAYTVRAEWEKGTGVDPRVSLEKAMRTFERSAEENPNSSVVFSNLGSAAATRGHYELDLGEDPTNSLQEAMEWLEKALEINPRNTTALFNRASIHRLFALFRLEHGLDPAAETAAALADLDRVEAVNSGYVGLRIERTRIQNLEARRLMWLGKDPSRILDQSERTIEQAAINHPYLGEVHVEAARIHLFRATWSLVGADDREAEIEAGLKAVDMALETNQRLADAFKIRGYLLLERASGLGPGSARNEVAEAAVEAFERALLLNPVLRRSTIDGLNEAKNLGVNSPQ